MFPVELLARMTATGEAGIFFIVYTAFFLCIEMILKIQGGKEKLLGKKVSQLALKLVGGQETIFSRVALLTEGEVYSGWVV